ncbi:type IV secretion system protein VirB10 [Bordetella sp. FB-8]|uniref:type IV secretion system protein VirB10 n=1 Tax=Bordetella sp. FB-8 TaxID=1159870 RepID=UPI0003731AA9|nr:type IV secretion system protein VirB10 [Bordetella sp. FB-8]
MSWLKGKRKFSRPVDAVDEIEAAGLDRDDDALEHGPDREHGEDRDSDHARPALEGVRRPMAPGSKVFFAVIGFGFLVLIYMLFSRFLHGTDTKKANNPFESKIGLVIPSLKLPKPQAPVAPAPKPPEVPPMPLNPALPGATALGLTGIPMPTIDPIEKRRLSGGLQSNDNAKQNAGGSTQQPPTAPVHDSGPMANMLQPLQLNAAQAGLVGDRDLILTQGSMIDCVQQTKFVSAQKGMITCYAPHDILSDSGRVVLIDAGTVFTGYQQGVLTQGVPRIAIVWSRMETPQGVIISLDSPGTGPLGEAGLDGDIDTHFAQRFGGAIMVSLVNDIGSWASNLGQSGNTFNLGSTGNAASSAVQTVLNNSINIPPTMYRNQGGRIGIYVARDLDFSTVYSLKPVGNR